MGHRCILPEQIEEILGIPSDDERRKEVEQCPRCRSLLRQYRAFSTITIDDMDEAAEVRPRLHRFLDERIRRGSEEAVDRESSLWARLAAVIRSRPALAAAAVVAAVILIVTLVPWQGADKGGIVLRGDEDAIAAFELPPADLSAPGHVSLHWRPVAGAEFYRVVIYDASFNEMFSRIVTDTALTLPTSELSRVWETASTLQWEVEALRHGDVVNRSKTGLLQEP